MLRYSDYGLPGYGNGIVVDPRFAPSTDGDGRLHARGRARRLARHRRYAVGDQASRRPRAPGRGGRGRAPPLELTRAKDRFASAWSRQTSKPTEGAGENARAPAGDHRRDPVLPST